MIMGGSCSNSFLTQDGQLIDELEFQDEQMGFVGISGIRWIILPDGSCQASRFVNNSILSTAQTGKLGKQDLATLSDILSQEKFPELPTEISSEPILNSHRLTIRLGEQSSTLAVQAGKSIEGAMAEIENQPETPRSRFLTIAQGINRLIQHNCKKN